VLYFVNTDLHILEAVCPCRLATFMLQIITCPSWWIDVMYCNVVCSTYIGRHHLYKWTYFVDIVMTITNYFDTLWFRSTL